jgi:ketosteroid isomerase-like protein
MSRENVEVVRRIFDRWAVGDFRAGIDDFDEHIVLIVPPDVPEFGVFVGVEGVGTYMRRLLDQWEWLSFEANSFREVNGTVLVSLTQHSRGQASGAEGELQYFMLFTFRGGKILRMESVREEEQALEAVGLSE